MAEHADRVVVNGKAITFDANRPRAEAIAIRGGTILALGTHAEISELAGPATHWHDAAGGTILPGFIESHMHLFPGGAELDALNLMGVADAETLTEAVRDRAAARPADPLLIGVCCTYTVLGQGRRITRQALDAVSPERPFAMIAHDHHTAWANTRALEMAGILAGGDAGPGAEIVMGADGLASGELREVGAFGPVFALSGTGGRESLGYVTGEDPSPPATPDQRAADVQILSRGLEHCARNGITTIHNMDGNLYQLELLKALETAGGLLCRTQIPLHLKPHHPLSRLEEAEEMRRAYSSEWLWSGRVKMFMDGVLDSHTAFMLRDYPDKPGWRGEALFGAREFAEAATACDARELQISVHAIGDAAVRRTLDGYAAARARNGPRDSRHRVEHTEILHPDDLPRFSELGVVASMQPPHSPRGGLFDPWPAGSILYEDQRKLAFAWSDIRRSGARLIFSSDWPVVPVDVMPSVAAACSGHVPDPSWGSQRQSLLEALAGYTCDGAYAEFAEDRKGRLMPGMMADLVVMSDDLEALPTERLAEARPTLTICGGRVTWQA